MCIGKASHNGLIHVLSCLVLWTPCNGSGGPHIITVSSFTQVSSRWLVSRQIRLENLKICNDCVVKHIENAIFLLVTFKSITKLKEMLVFARDDHEIDAFLWEKKYPHMSVRMVRRLDGAARPCDMHYALSNWSEIVRLDFILYFQVIVVRMISQGYKFQNKR